MARSVTRSLISNFSKYILSTFLFIIIIVTGAWTDSEVDNTCLDDGSVLVRHQDIHFTFFHNHTHEFIRYQVQTNISFSVNSLARHKYGGVIKFQLHGRCPSWTSVLNNDSYLFVTSTTERVDGVDFSCCALERDTMIVTFPWNSDMSLFKNFTLVLATIEEKTESDLVGVTRVPLTASGLSTIGHNPGGNHTGTAMVMTNFHDIFARHSFPLVDSLTSLYTMALSITVDETGHQHHPHVHHHLGKDLVVLANTALSSTSIKYFHNPHGAGRSRVQTWIFEPTPPMPGSYLAFVIGRFHRNTGLTTRRQHEINVWTLPGASNSNHLESTRFALEMTSIIIDYFEEEFDFPYPLSKMDIVEAPLDYEAFVVWGLCFIKPGRLHVFKGAQNGHWPAGFAGGAPALPMRETVPKKKELTETLAHEISHQWFGSLVTPQTWNDVFLSESFATFYGVEAIRFAKGVPRWMASEAMITALTHRKISLHTDPTIPISSPVMYKNWSRDVQFSTIVYHKGATLLRMLKWVIGDTAFRDGVRKYLRRFQYSNARANDFLDVFDEAVRKHQIPGWNDSVLDVKAFIKPYIYQPSYPVINVKVNQTHATLTQEPFVHQVTQKQPASPDTYQWYVPITVHLQSKHMKTYWLQPNDTLCLPVSDFGFMVRLFHLYAIRPTHESVEDGDDIGGDEHDDGDVDILD